VDGPFAVINADDFYGRGGYAMLAKALSSQEKAGGRTRHYMVGFTLRNTLSEFGAVSRGVCQCDADGVLKEVVERTKIEADGKGGAEFLGENGAKVKLTGEETVSMNMWGFRLSLFSELERLFIEFLKAHGSEAKSEFYIPFAVAGLIQEGVAEVEVLRSPDAWFGVTYREDKPRVQASVKALIDAADIPLP
jgi:hypothetical protein